MEPTRRFYSAAGLATATAVLALLFSKPLLFAAPLGVGLWVLAHQVAFARTLGGLASDPPLAQSVAPETVLVDDTTVLTVTCEAPKRLAALDARLVIDPPAALDAQGDRHHEVTDSTRTVTVPLRVGVAGTYEIHPPEVECTSRGGLFRETLRLGDTCSVTGEPRVPRGVHVGTGGQQIAVAYGEHDAKQGGVGFDPGELREYSPGDPTNRIDWNATARLDETYVREFNAETVRQTQLIVDTRDHMADGPAGRTKLDYAREIATSVTEHVARFEDPLGVLFVGDDRATGPVAPVAGPEHYQRVRRLLDDFSTTSESDTKTDSRGRASSARHAFTPERTAQRLATTGDDAYSRTLRPYVLDAEAYVERLTDQPLFRSVTERLDAQADDSWFVLVTDDSNREELFETVRAATTRGVHVSVFLLPSVLFAADGLADVEGAYDDYVDFESFRQRLAGLNGVDAFEVGPEDRFTALLETARAEEVRR